MRFSNRMASEILRVEHGQMRAVLYHLEDKTWFVRFFLRSRIKTNILSQDSFHRDDEHREKRIQAIGGALAEYQNETYGDMHNPGEMAKLATEAFEKLMSELERKMGSHTDRFRVG